jgi:hypothetical protein
MKKTYLLLALTMFAICNANTSCRAQLSYGTAIIAVNTGDVAVIAADSLKTSLATGAKSYTCKIQHAGQYGLVSVSGLASDATTPDFNISAARMLGKSVITNQDDLERISQQWMESIHQELLRGLPMLNKYEISTLVGEGGGVAAVFTSLDANKHIVMNSTLLTMQLDTADRVTFLPISTKDGRPSIGGNMNGALVLGNGVETWQEIAEGKTPRSQPFRSLLNTIRYTKSTKELLSSTATFISVAEAWYPKDVGGKVDQVALTKAGVRWISIKPNCPQKLGNR